MYLKEIGRVELLTSEEEYDLAVLVDRAKKARLEFEYKKQQGIDVTLEELAEYEELVKRGDFASSNSLKLIYV